MTRNAQDNCVGSFEEIAPRLARGQRQSGQSVDWEAPAGDYPASGSLFDHTVKTLVRRTAKLLHVSGQTARPARESGQSQTLRQGIDCFAFIIGATLDDFATPGKCGNCTRPIRMQLR